MSNYMVIAGVAKKKYMIKVEADSACGAENLILAKGVNGIMGEYGVMGALAFDQESMKTDTFYWMSMAADLVSMDEFDKIVEDNNKLVALHVAIFNKKSEINSLEYKLKRAKNELGELYKSDDGSMMYIPF